MATGVPQADGTVKPEPLMDVKHAGDAVLHMANLPLDVNVQFMTIMAHENAVRRPRQHAARRHRRWRNANHGKAATGRQPLRLPTFSRSIRDARRDRQRSSSIPRGNPDQGLNTKPGLIATSAGMGCRSANSSG